jgi:DNA-binding transcriptional regulator YhcF (GntR family)
MPAHDFLPIIVDSSAPITINAQIAEQIKLLIAMGELQPGDTLPTVTQLAKQVGVNHNTLAAVYNDLISSDYLVAQRGKGTFVANTQAVQNIITSKQFYSLLGQVFSTAKIIGLSPSEFCTAAYAQAVMLNRHYSSNLKLVFIECLHSSVDVYTIIQSEIKIPLLFLSLEDLMASQPIALKELWAADLVITTAQHQLEVIDLTERGQEVIFINLKPDVQLLTQISSKPRNTTVLLVSRSEADSEDMKRILVLAGISHISFQTLDLKSLEQNPQVLSQFDLVCVSKLIEEHIRQYSHQPDNIIVFDFSINESNVSVLKARIATIQLGKSII